MQTKIKVFMRRGPSELYRPTFLQNKIDVFIVDTVKLNNFRPDQSTRFGSPQAITSIFRWTGLGVNDLVICLAFTFLDHYREKYAALAEHHKTPKIKKINSY